MISINITRKGTLCTKDLDTSYFQLYTHNAGNSTHFECEETVDPINLKLRAFLQGLERCKGDNLSHKFLLSLFQSNDLVGELVIAGVYQGMLCTIQSKSNDTPVTLS